MTSQFPVKGLKELDAYLSALPKNMQKDAYRAGLVAAAAVIRDEARLLAPKATGVYAKSIKSGSARQNQDGSFSITVRPAGPHGYLGLFHEYGVAPHFIAAGDADVSAKTLNRSAKRGNVVGDVERQALKIGDNYITGTITHPGHRATPHFRPALDNKADEAVQAFAGRIRAYLEGVKSKTGYDVIAGLDEAA